MPTPNQYYLELSVDEAVGTAHKFYQVQVKDTTVTICNGRIGTDGTTREYPKQSKQAAIEFAASKVRQKLKKGYEEAVRGERVRRSVARRPSASATSSAKPAPCLWRFNSKRTAFGIFVDDERCWLGNEDGHVYGLDHEGKVQTQFRLPDGVKCLVGDERWLYAGCDNGKVYDLTGKMAKESYEIEADRDIYWMDVCDAVLGVSDEDGNIGLINHENEELWKRESEGSSGWMVRCEAQHVFHGTSAGITCYTTAVRSRKKWFCPLRGSVLFGWQEKKVVYAGCSDNAVYAVDKKNGKIVAKFQCDATIYSNAASPDGELVFAGDNCSSIYCFDKHGTRLWKFATGCGSALSMQYRGSRVIIVTTDGTMACFDVSDEALKRASEDKLPKTRSIGAPKAVEIAVASPATLPTTRSTRGKVILECVKVSGKLRVRARSEGYKSTWNVQFPRSLRSEGARYVVDELRAAGSFYRVVGDVKKLRS